MARIRTIKPEFWTSEQIVECSPNARLMFIGLMNFADDNGVHPDKAMRIKMQVFPGDDLSSDCIEDLLCQLDDAGLIRRYSVAGEKYLLIKGFTKHQKIDQPSYKYPLPDGSVPENPARRRNDSSGVRRTNGERSPPEGKGREGNGKEGIVNTADKRPSKRAHALPDDWKPNDGHRELAGKSGLSVTDEIDKFTDYHKAKGSIMKDWDAAFRTWLRNAEKFKQKDQPQKPASKIKPFPGVGQ